MRTALALLPFLFTSQHGELVENGSFDAGRDGWRVIDNSGTFEAVTDRRTKRRGVASLRLAKSGGSEFDLIRCDIDPASPKFRAATHLRVRAWLKCRNLRRAWFKLFVWDRDGRVVNATIDLKKLTGASPWQRIEFTEHLLESAHRASVMLLVQGRGTVWIDDVSVRAEKRGERRRIADIANLVENASFEAGTTGWSLINNSGKTRIDIVETVSENKQQKHKALRLRKIGGTEFDVVRRELTPPPRAGRVRVSAVVKCEKLQRAFLKLWQADRNEKPVGGTPDVARIEGTRDWHRVTREFDISKDTHDATLMIVVIGSGELQLRDVVVRPIAREPGK